MLRPKAAARPFTRPASQAPARARSVAFDVKPIATGALLALGLAVLATGTLAEQEVIKAHGVSTFGELKYDADFPHFDYVNPEAPKGGEYSSWAFGTFDSLSPYIIKGNAAAGSSLFFDTLLTGNLEEPDAMYGLVAHTLEYPENREWVIFHMRPEAKFSDGSQLTAHDVVFSYDVLLEKGQPRYKSLFKDIIGAEAIDDYTVKFTFKPDGALRELLMTAGGLPIFSKAYYETVDFAESTLEPPIGSGPYLLDKVDPGRSVSYKRRNDYWAKDLPVNVGTLNFDVLKYEYFGDYLSAFEAFKAGAYTYREEYTSKTWATAYDFPALNDGYMIKETLPDGRPTGTQGFWFNMRRDKFQDPRVREALGMAFNFEWSNESLFYGLYGRTDSFWENSPTLQASGMPPAEELAILEPLREYFPEEVFTEEAFTPAVSKSIDLADRRALRRAGKLLDEAGWEVGDDGLRYKDGQQLTLEILNDVPGYDRIINPYVENLKRLGVAAVHNRVDAAEAKEREKNYDYDMVTQRFVMSNTPGDELEQLFGSATVDTVGGYNMAGLNNEGIDKLIDIIANAKSREELDVAVRALDRVLRAMHIWVPQWYKGSHNIAYLDVYGRPYTDTPPPLSIGQTSIWWWDEDKAQRLRDAGAL
ncbi:Oligopeptide-binding protein AppA precursor [Pelagimonas phthalicica]|uniref:Oligopeptide-binding protein AppA n=1 Tax=Pelagimonas phthalicica TaxID=1037362 RepID=A0A238JBG8_9RHOB|nr:extracellular solute-binding protein [Pelagimonas phthalicica]TDS94277.1 microcin C transport system substrate-binding protein [Pelagimonas phthalicica]SMX27196.1 Oligopeptide-binding protein AppA precursor [Pelagimonas phthalicica]